MRSAGHWKRGGSDLQRVAGGGNPAVTSVNRPFRFSDLVPMLICRDVPATPRFYTEVLGFEVADEWTEVPDKETPAQ